MMPNGEGGKSCLYMMGKNNNHFKLLSDLNNQTNNTTIRKNHSLLLISPHPHIPLGPSV